MVFFVNKNLILISSNYYSLILYLKINKYNLLRGSNPFFEIKIV